MEHFDVIVVGGSVAGAPAATWLARKGYHVLLLDKAQFPRDTNSTHFVWPRGMSYLNRLGVAEDIVKHTPHYTTLELNLEGICLHGSVPIQAIKDRFKALHGNDDGVVGYYAGPRRFYLDQRLLEEAGKSGVDVRQGVTVEGVLTEEDRVKGVRGVGRNGCPIEAQARVVIGADGRFSAFAGYVGAKKSTVREQSTFAYYGYFSGIAKDELVIHKKGRFGTAIFPTMHQKHLVLVYGPTAWWGAFSQDREANFFRTYDFVAPDVAALVRQGKREEDFKAMGRMVAFHRDTWGKGWVLIGDAGSFKDQWTAMGITHALRDAELLSEYLDTFLQGEVSWEEAMSTYAQIRIDDYEEYWHFVCDGAEMQPYTRDQLEFFYRIKNDQKKVDTFIGQVGDTIRFKDAIIAEDPAHSALPAFLRSFDSHALGYHTNMYMEDKKDVMVMSASVS